MSTDARYNLLLTIAVGIGSFLLITFVVASSLSRGGEIAGALGSLIGGIIGAGGAVATVYLLIGRQREEEAKRVTDAIRREVIEFSKFITAALECCAHIKSGLVTVPRKSAHSMMITLDPIIYKAIADRISLVPYPQQVVAFYVRVVEAQAAIHMIIDMPGDDDAPIPAILAETIAETLITACQLAGAIISHVPGENLDEQVSQITMKHIIDALDEAKRCFPDAESFN